MDTDGPRIEDVFDIDGVPDYTTPVTMDHATRSGKTPLQRALEMEHRESYHFSMLGALLMCGVCVLCIIAGFILLTMHPHPVALFGIMISIFILIFPLREVLRIRDKKRDGGFEKR